MKKTVCVGYLGFLIFLISTSIVYSQTDKDLSLKNQPQGEVATDSDQYVIGPEDVLYINVWREEALSRTVTVRIDGKISLPLMDEIHATGYTPLQLKEVITQKLKEFIDEPIVTVIVTEANSHKVYITGRVRTPGIYKIRSEISIIQLISMAGGVTDWANTQRILVIRKEEGKERVITVNYKKVMKGEDLSSNLILKAGDTIIVP